MPGKPPGEIVLGIIRVLEEEGEATRSEIAAALGRSTSEAGSVISRMNKPTATKPKRLYIIRYRYFDDVKRRRYPRAVYALGDLPDARKPKPDILANKRRSRENKKLRVNSVFQWAMPRRAREQERRNAGIPK